MASTSCDTIEEMVNINKEKKKKNVFDYHSILLFTNQWLNGVLRRIGIICNGGSMVEKDTLIQPCLIFVFFQPPRAGYSYMGNWMIRRREKWS